MAQPHSGWTNSSASGSASTRARSSSPLMPACTWHSPAQMCRFSRPVSALDVRAEELVGAEQHLAVGSGSSATTSTAFDDVQQMSVTAFTAAVVLT